jgi:aspartate carbamoyltransferase catalytic subunit
MGSILSIGDLSDDDIDSILARARTLCGGTRSQASSCRRLLTLIFLEPSLRTRVGFTAAAVRLGWQCVNVFERRHGQLSKMESWFDTLRAVAGYSDVIVARPAQPLGPDDLIEANSCPLINGGDVGAGSQHPSQALIDLFAIEELAGPVGSLTVAIVGDPRMRSVRSLLDLLARRPPAMLVMVGDYDHLQEVELPPELQRRARLGSWEEMTDVDIVYLAGIPHEALPLHRRNALLATAERVEALPRHCLLLSPMPVIDEMDFYVRRCDRNRMFEQSDLGLYVRMALLEHVVRDNSQ